MTTESICFISEHGISAPIDLCLLNEGVDCHLYVHEKDYRPIYKNIIPRLSLDALERTLKSCSHVVIDMVRPNHGKPEDIELLKRFGVNPKTVDAWAIEVRGKLVDAGIDCASIYELRTWAVKQVFKDC